MTQWSRLTFGRLVGRLALLALLTACVLAFGVAVGVEKVSWRRCLDPGSVDRAIVVGARLSRVLLAAVVGAGLASSSKMPLTMAGVNSFDDKP